MNIIRTTIWLILCLALAAGLLLFGLVYAGLRVVFNRFEWKQVSFPTVKFAK